MTKRAVIVGVDDYSQQNSLPLGWSVSNLSACVADVVSIQDLLTSAFGFDEITGCLTDSAASRDAILQSVTAMLSVSNAGDVACVFYSGHGGRFPADVNTPNRYYECIIPASGAPITDLDIYRLASSLDFSFVNFTLILDSCNSGGIHENTPDSPVRSVAYSSDYVQMCVSAMDTVIPCGVTIPAGTAILDGNINQVSGQGNGVVCSMDDNKSLVSQSKSTVLAACRYDESALESNGHGILTWGLLNMVNASNFQINHLDLVDTLRTTVQTRSPQTPTLLGQKNRMTEGFLQGWTQSK